MAKNIEIKLTLADMKMAKKMWEWRNDPVTRKMSYYSKNLSYKEFFEWLKSKLSRDNVSIYVGSVNGEPFGQVRFDIKNRNFAEVNIVIGTEHRNKGLGTTMLTLACKKLHDEKGIKRVVAHIKPDNPASVRAFEKAGFVNIGFENVRGFKTVEMLFQNNVTENKNPFPKKVLAIVAHPDDEILGCGGTLIRHAQCGDEVHIAILGEGKTSRYELGAPEKGSRKELLKFDSEINNAVRIIGATKLYRYNFPDNRFDSVELLDIVKVLEKLKEEIHPDIVYTHHRFDINIDHSVSNQAVITAFRPIAGELSTKILVFETPSSTEWQMPGHNMEFSPNYFVDISSVMEKKLEALKCYQSELRTYPHPRSLKSVEIIAKRWGINVGLYASEPFMLVREIVL